MRYPGNLPENGTIGFVAPSFGCNIEPYRTCFEEAQKKIKAMGYSTKLGPNCYAGEGVGISNTPEKCAKELMDAYLDRDIDAIMSCGGGELMCEILEHMDFDALKKADPKWYMGYSDNTNMTYLLATLCDTASIYGPCAPTFGMEPWHQSQKDAFDLLTGKRSEVSGYPLWEKESLKDEEHPTVFYQLTEEKVLKSYIGNRQILDEKITFRGRLLGGCMDCLVNLLGTSFDKTADFIEKYKEDGIIWFLESCDLNVFAIRRAMWQMEQAGWFQYVKGFLIGRPLVYGQEMMGLDTYQAVLKVVATKQVPVIMDVDLGHLPPMMPVIVGSMAEVTVKDNDIALLFDKI